ncbi:MAG: hypothetical protein IK147_04555, partial [Clostridia bacterium]|nr:hypothetical protein [Clostridia bacterium]
MMKKLYYSILTFLSVVCLAIGVMLMTGVGYGANKANAETVSGQTPTFSATKYMVSSDGESILFVTAIGDCDDVYSVGYSIVIDPSLTVVHAPQNKYYTSLTIGGNTWTTADLFGAGYTGMIVGEYTGYTRNATIKVKIYAHVGDREDDALVESATTEWGTEINPVEAFDSEGVIINFPEPVDTDKTIAVDVKFTSAASTEIDFFLRGAGEGNWLKGFGNIWMKPDGTRFNYYDGVSVADIGDGWYRITIDMAAATQIFNEKPAQVAAFEVKGGSGFTTASGYIAYMGVVEPDIHAGAVAFDSTGVIINFPEPVDTDKTIAVDVKFTSAASTEIDFFIRGTDSPNSNYYGNIWMKVDGTRFDYWTGISVADIGDGWYRITIDLAAANKITGTKPAQVGDFRVVG